MLRDVKSNLVEEAIIVFKENVKIREKQLIKGEERKEGEEEKIALVEAQNVILDYIGEYEKEKKRNIQRTKMRILKGVNIFLVILLIVAIIF